MAVGRVLVATGDGPLVASPTWDRFDDFSDCRCHGFDTEAGRQSELDVTDTGTARVFFHDRVKRLDDDDLIGCQIMLQLYNPVTAEWVPRWRGHIDDINTQLSPAAPTLANVQFECVDIFDYLGGVKMLPGVFGNVPPAGMNAIVFYEDANVDDRIIALLSDAALDSAMYIPFTGNVSVNETLYDPNDSILQALRDAADAEFPGVANVYVDRLGRVVFHGRKARFEPEIVAGTGNWDFVRWYAATRSDVTTGFAQIREFGFNRPRARIINSYLAWPRADENGVEFDRSLIEGLLRTDPSSITAYGYRGRDAPDLIIKANINNSNPGSEECAQFADFYVTNYAAPRKSIQQITVKSVRPDDDRAEATWAFMCGVDISDAVNLTVAEADLDDVPFFVDGVSVSCRPLNPDFDLVTVTPNLTPASYYGTDVFS